MLTRKTAKVNKSCLICLVFVFSFFVLAAGVSFGAEGGSEGGNWFSNLAKNWGSSMSNMFSEIGSADAGTKPRIKPHFSTSTSFISNQNFGTNQGSAAFLARVAPGLGVTFPVGDKLYTEADYVYGLSFTQGRKAAFNVGTHNINALARYDLTSDTVLGASNNIQWSESPDRSGSTFFLETATGEVSHRFDEKLSGRVSDTFQHYKPPQSGTSNAQYDFNDNGVATSLSYELTEKLGFGPSFSWNARHFDNVTSKEKDYWQISPGLGVGYQLGPKTSLAANFGWAYRDFTVGKGHGESELVWGAAVTHLLSKKLVWALNYSKTLQDTFVTDFVNRQDNPTATNFDNLNANFRVVKVHMISTTGTYNFNEKNSVAAFMGWQFTEANAKDNVLRSDSFDRGISNNETTMETGASYGYRLTRYMSVDLGYTFGRRFKSPNDPSRHDYTFHKLTGGLNISF